LRVLADEARRQMLWLLMKHRELCVCDLMGTLGIIQSKASRHLATLRHAGLAVPARGSVHAGRRSFEKPPILPFLRAESRGPDGLARSHSTSSPDTLLDTSP
jgi:hypothetical protein